MSPKFRLLALLAGFALAACQTSPPPWKGPPPSHSPIPTSQPCDGTSCDVKIDYEREGTNCDPPYCYPIAPVHVIVAPPRVVDPPSITMVWRLPSDSAATFGKNGIHFKDAKSGFDCKPGSPEDAKDAHAFHCNNKRLKTDNPDPEEDGWKYSILLDLPSDKGKLKPLDPWVVNR